MSAEMVQMLIYIALAAAGFAARHFAGGKGLNGVVPAISSPPATPSPVTPDPQQALLRDMFAELRGILRDVLSARGNAPLQASDETQGNQAANSPHVVPVHFELTSAIGKAPQL